MQTLTKTLSGSQIIIQTLKQLGIDTIFGYPGGIVLEIYDALSKQNDIKHYLVRHEQAACHAAEGYARASQKCAAVLVTSGPGATNLVTGLANAYLDGTPLIAITGQVSANLLHTDAFQEVDIINITKSCTKKNFQVTNINDLQSTLQIAYRIATEGKKGPVLIDITKNVFSESTFLIDNISTFEKTHNLNDIDISKASNLIENSERPLIISGGGASLDEVIKLSKTFDIPVVTTMMGFYPQDDSHNIGMLGIFGDYSANKAVEESDLLIAVGTRFNDRIKGFINYSDKDIIHIDINEREISKVIPATVGIVGDSGPILTEICKNIKSRKFSEWLKYSNSLKLHNKAPQKRTNLMHSFEVMQEIKNYIKKLNPIITTEVGQHQVLATKYLKTNPNKFISSCGLGTMGFGLPAAIGASIAANKSLVVCISGDGSFQMNMQELATCIDYKLPIKIFILNNGYLGMVRQFQEKSCNERYYATKISGPDFVKLAESYNIKGIRVQKKEDIKSALDNAFATESPVIVDFVVESMEIV